MNNIVAYLMSTPEIRHIVFVAGKESSPWLLRDICSSRDWDSLIYFCADKENEVLKEVIYCVKEIDRRKMPAFFSVHNYEEFSSFQPETTDFVLVYDALDEFDSLLDWVNLKPKYLCGTAKANKTSAFDVWEAYRKICKQMYLVTWDIGCPEEVLNWKKRENSDIELSIVFPMYNVADYLPQCISSVTAWKADYVEYLFVDDGSPDNCADIVRKASVLDPRVKLLQKPNGGCASARQYGLDRARGRYIGFIDPDDFIDESMYRKLFSRAMNGTYEISYCGYNELYEETGGTRKVADLLGEPYRSGTTDPVAIRDLIPYLRVAIWRGIYSADMIRKNGIHFYTDLRRFDDLPFKFEVLSVAKSVVSVPEYLYYYRLARPGQDVLANDDRLYVHFPIFEHLDEFVNKKATKELIRMLQIVKLHTHKYALLKIKKQYIKTYLKQARKDLLSNMSLNQIVLTYRRAISRQDKMFFWAIYLRSKWLIKALKRRDESRKSKAQNKRNIILGNLKKCH